MKQRDGGTARRGARWRRGRILAALAAVNVAAGLAAARAPARAEELSLAAAIELSRGSSPSLAASRRRAAAAAAQATVAARVFNWPRLALASGWTATDQPAAVFAQRLDAGVLEAADLALGRLTSPSARGHLESALAVELPLDAFAKAAPLRQGAAAEARAADQTAREAELETVLAVTMAWHRALVAARAVEATARTLAAAGGREAELEAQAGEGSALRADLLRARTRRRRLEADLATRQAELETARAALALAIGTEREVAPAGEPSAPEPPGALEPWLDRGARRPAVAAARAAAEAATARELGERRSARPDLLLSAALRDDRGPLDAGQASGAGGVFVRWSLYDPARAARRGAAASARGAAEADLDAAMARARFEVAAAWNAAAAAHERWLASRGGTEEGREALRVVRERRAAGLATLTDELETEAAALGAELDELAAAAEAAVARAALARAAGFPHPATPAKEIEP